MSTIPDPDQGPGRLWFLGPDVEAATYVWQPNAPADPSAAYRALADQPHAAAAAEPERSMDELGEQLTEALSQVAATTQPAGLDPPEQVRDVDWDRVSEDGGVCLF